MRHLLALCLVMPAAAAQPTVRIDLLPRVQVTDSVVLLGDVAHLHADDLGLMRKLVHLPVGRAPEAGQSAVLQRADLAQWIRRQAGVAMDRLAWEGPQESRVSRIARQLKGEDVARAAVETANAYLLAAGRSAAMQARRVPRDVDLPEGSVRLEVRGAGQGLWSRRALLWVDVWAAGAFVRTVPVPLELAGEAQLPEPDGLVPLQPPVRTVRPGRDDHEPLAVLRGEWASLRSVAGAISLESRVEVLQDGRPGQKVRVRQQGATGPVSARVVGPAQVEIAP